MPSLSAPGSACRRPLFLRTIALLTSFLTLPGKFGALSPTLARSKLRPMRRQGSQASGRRGTGPAPPRPAQPSALQWAPEHGGWGTGTGGKYVAAGRTRGGVGRARWGPWEVRKCQVVPALCPVPGALGLMPDGPRCSVSAWDYLELGRRWHQLRQDCERNPNSGRFRGERSPNTCCS